MAHYRPQAFDAADEQTARAIILTPEGSSVEERWARETPYVGNRLAELLDLRAGDTVVDFGCGIGRVARDLIVRIGCEVVGVDISPTMRAMATDYVASARFRAIDVAEFDRMAASGFRAYAAYTCWVLQHCIDPRAEVARIAGALPPASCIAVLNSAYTQAIPTEAGWNLDRLDMRALLQESLTELNAEKLPPEVAAPDLRDTAFFGLYRTPAAQARPAAAPAPRRPGLFSRLLGRR